MVFRLKEPYIPFVAIMANPWFGYVVNKKWVVAQGEWDGSCETWRKFHNPKAQDSELYKKMNGTGPFKFEHWIPDQEVSLVRNDNYWRGMPDCVQYNKKEECTGPTKLQRVVTKAISEWSTRLLMLQSGDADWVYIPLPNWDQIQPMINDGRLTVYKDLPTLGQSVWYFAWNVNASNNPYIGSGKLDGQGIPPDFFSDIHIRKAFAQAFDVEKYIREVLRGDAVFARGLIIPSVFGHNPNQENYRFNLEQATQHFKQAWNGEVWKKGFKVVVTLTPGSVEGRAGYEMLKKAIESINPQFHIEIQEITDAQSIEDWNADRVPFGGNGWYEDFHDPHSWVQSYLYSKGYFGIRRHLPSDLQTKIDDLVIRARKELDPEKRKQLYYELQRINYEAVIIVPTSEAVSRFALRSWVQGYFYNPLGLTSDYYLWKR
ncbi:hypothetical protein HY009_05375 [Candidatus Acetothermia bacterium]|nr:hypothetical protein [Candidatus Acetothermia bacterium]